MFEEDPRYKDLEIATAQVVVIFMVTSLSTSGSDPSGRTFDVRRRPPAMATGHFGSPMRMKPAQK